MRLRGVRAMTSAGLAEALIQTLLARRGIERQGTARGLQHHGRAVKVTINVPVTFSIEKKRSPSAPPQFND
jgi:hypothetical protein